MKPKITTKKLAKDLMKKSKIFLRLEQDFFYRPHIGFHKSFIYKIGDGSFVFCNFKYISKVTFLFFFKVLFLI